MDATTGNLDNPRDNHRQFDPREGEKTGMRQDQTQESRGAEWNLNLKDNVHDSRR